ncbi:MAG: HlyD family efflux transporter periplasmic adaptor subunit [Bacteroidales bacterium]|jgi:HlyD family secretion protein|nr:HlyD family efflux transporter periplasmic adaptor subunit [Bacteroidales bacterium]
MKTMKRLIISLIAVLLFACGDEKKHSDATGVFEATEVLVSAEATGKILRLDLNEGDEISATFEAGYIDTTQLFLKKMQLQASLKALQSRKTDIPKQIAALNQQIASQKNELKRFENLAAMHVGNQKQVDDIRAQILVLEKQVAAQTEMLQNTNSSISAESSGLEIQIAQLNDLIHKSIITGTINGTVLAKYAEAGELALQGKPLFKVADMKNIYLRAYIEAGQLTQLKLGQTVNVYADFGENNSREYAGIVAWISDKAEFTPKTVRTRNERTNLVYAVKIAIKNDGYLKKGMYGELRIRN